MSQPSHAQAANPTEELAALVQKALAIRFLLGKSVPGFKKSALGLLAQGADPDAPIPLDFLPRNPAFAEAFRGQSAIALAQAACYLGKLGLARRAAPALGHDLYVFCQNPRSASKLVASGVPASPADCRFLAAMRPPLPLKTILAAIENGHGPSAGKPEKALACAEGLIGARLPQSALEVALLYPQACAGDRALNFARSCAAELRRRNYKADFDPTSDPCSRLINLLARCGCPWPGGLAPSGEPGAPSQDEWNRLRIESCAGAIELAALPAAAGNKPALRL